MYFPSKVHLQAALLCKHKPLKVQQLLQYWRSEARMISHVAQGKIGGSLEDFGDRERIRNHIRRLRLLRRDYFHKDGLKIRVRKQRILQFSGKIDYFEYSHCHG